MAHCSCLRRGDWDRPQEVHRSRRAGHMWFRSLPESGERRSGLLSLLNRHSGKGQAPSSQSCDRGGRGLAGGGMLDVTGCRWALRTELAAPGGLLAGWTTPSLLSGGNGGASPMWIFIRDPEKAQGRVSLRQSCLPLFLIPLKMLSVPACHSFCCFLSKSTESLSLAGAVS